LLRLGRVIGVHGLNGTIQIFSDTRPAIGIAGYSRWWIGPDAVSARQVDVTRCWAHGRRILARIAGIERIEQAEALRGQSIFVPREMVALAEDEYLWQDLIGCTVEDRALGRLGCVVALEDYGAQDILVVRADANCAQQGEWMIPFIDGIICDVDLTARAIQVLLPEGMDACFTPRS